ncbi:hypothetical protein FRC14_005658 [Serendipita sp. 396]|nr:hypothetical protein FRC14_005658 [Serendipita sp. 396]KAG8779886.1 hypothetical protein FRC15_009867 [Serendipita sp. 397]KAG8819753.1 hypothetical protein FRC19_009566 [Serendipita sp. 401]KAG8847597.1 hypothetical protein FRB91_011662 [Serendipita sp. 411]
MALLFTTQTLVQGILGHYVKIKANYWFPSSECCPSLPLNSPSTDRMQSIISLHSRSPFNVSPSLKPMKPGFTSLHRKLRIYQFVSSSSSSISFIVEIVS